MAFRPVLCTIVAALLLTTVFSSSSEAQRRGFNQPGQKALRWLGQGYSAGYHWRTPGSNPDYYNPYSAHNSLLISQQGGGFASGLNVNNQSGSGGIPYSSYAPNGLGYGSQDQAGQLITPSFEPAQSEQNTESANDFEVESNDDSEESIDDVNAAESDESVGPRTKLRLNSGDFSPASYSKRVQPSTNSNSEWSLDDPFDDKYSQ